MKHSLSVLFLVFICINPSIAQPSARQGVVDLRAWNFEKKGSIKLNGEWEFYMRELIDPVEFLNATKAAKDFINFPDTWNETSKSNQPGKGFAAYHVQVLVQSPQQLALDLPHFYSSFTLWINNRKIASNGVVGKSQETSKPQWLPQTVRFEATTDTLDIVIHTSNFHHALGGVRESIMLGQPNTLLFKRDVAVTGNVILCGSLIVIALTFIAVYFFKNENSALFFAALCVTWAIREAFSNLYIFTNAYPDFPWEMAVKIEYITLYLTMIWALFFLSSIFPDDMSSIFKYLFATCNIIFLLFTLFVDASFYTQFLQVYISFAFGLLIYIIYVLIHAVVYERHGVWLIVSCMMLGVIVFAYDLIAYEGFTSYNSIITNTGYLVMFILMAFCLFLQYGFIKRSSGRMDVLTYDELYGTHRK